MRRTLLTTATLLILAQIAVAQQDQSTIEETIESAVVRPQRLTPSEADIAALKKADGVEISTFATGLGNPRILAVSDTGRIYATRRLTGDLIMLEDSNGDGKAEVPKVVLTRPDLHGLTIHDRVIYLATVRDVFKARLNADGTLGEVTRIVDDLPDGGQHPNRTLAVGPDGYLYVTVGSTCNACLETNQESATILRMKTDGSEREIFASGLRNTIGLGWTASGELYGMDQGVDFLGNNAQMEELNLIARGKSYGWPYALEDNRINLQTPEPPNMRREDWASMSEIPVLLYRAHSSPMQMAFAPDVATLPESLRGDAFVAMRGSWNRNPPSGYEIVRIDFEDGKPIGFEPFISGFLKQTESGWGYLGRPVGIGFAPDGTMYVSDDSNGAIYKIIFGADPAATAALPAPQPGAGTADQGLVTSDPTGKGDRLDRVEAVNTEQRAIPNGGRLQQARQAAPPLLTKDVLPAPGDAMLAVTAADFGDGQVIPKRNTKYGEGISPALRWDEGPEGTQSFVLMMEDADVPAERRPFSHWIVYDIPASTTALPSGVSQQF